MKLLEITCWNNRTLNPRQVETNIKDLLVSRKKCRGTKQVDYFSIWKHFNNLFLLCPSLCGRVCVFEYLSDSVLLQVSQMLS